MSPRAPPANEIKPSELPLPLRVPALEYYKHGQKSGVQYIYNGFSDTNRDGSSVKPINNVEHTAFSLIFPNSVETPLWLTALFNIEHFSFVSVQSKGICTRDCSSGASDITAIICLSEWEPAGRTPLKATHYKKGVQF